MAGQTIFENPIAVNSDSCLINEQKNAMRTAHPRLKDVFRNTITRQEAEHLVKSAVSPDAELVDYHLRPYSEEKIGFLGTHLCLVVVTRKAGTNKRDKHSFFVKTVPYDVPSQAAYVEEKGCFRKEADFFRFLVPLLTKSYVGGAWTPRCYMAKEDTLVFEDMKGRGFSNRSKGFDEQTMKSAVACIARFHACSLLAEEKLDGKSLKDLHPELLEESEFKHTGRSYEWYSTAIDLAVALADDLGLDSSSIRRASERVFDIAEPSRTKRNVVSHGDLWSSNMIFDQTGGCNLVDFQLVRYAPLAHDLMQVIYLCSTRQFRARHELRVIEHYYATLKETLIISRFRGVIPSYEEVLQGAEEQRLPALVTAMIFHPTVLMDGKTAARIMDDPVTYEAYYFRDRRPFVKEIMAADAEYEGWIKETVRELAEMSAVADSLPRPS